MFVKWAIIKLLITMHLAMPADILTKAVDLETHTKMRNLMMNIPWAAAFYRRVGLPPEREAAGRNTSSSNTEPVLETAHEDAEPDDEHSRGSTAFYRSCLLYTSPSPRDKRQSRMPSSA